MFFLGKRLACLDFQNHIFTEVKRIVLVISSFGASQKLNVQHSISKVYVYIIKSNIFTKSPCAQERVSEKTETLFYYTVVKFRMASCAGIAGIVFPIYIFWRV